MTLDVDNQYENQYDDNVDYDDDEHEDGNMIFPDDIFSDDSTDNEEEATRLDNLSSFTSNPHCYLRYLEENGLTILRESAPKGVKAERTERFLFPVPRVEGVLESSYYISVLLFHSVIFDDSNGGEKSVTFAMSNMFWKTDGTLTERSSDYRAVAEHIAHSTWKYRGTIESFNLLTGRNDAEDFVTSVLQYILDDKVREELYIKRAMLLERVHIGAEKEVTYLGVKGSAYECDAFVVSANLFALRTRWNDFTYLIKMTARRTLWCLSCNAREGKKETCPHLIDVYRNYFRENKVVDGDLSNDEMPSKLASYFGPPEDRPVTDDALIANEGLNPYPRRVENPLRDGMELVTSMRCASCGGALLREGVGNDALIMEARRGYRGKIWFQSKCEKCGTLCEEFKTHEEVQLTIVRDPVRHSVRGKTKGAKDSRIYLMCSCWLMDIHFKLAKIPGSLTSLYAESERLWSLHDSSLPFLSRTQFIRIIQTYLEYVLPPNTVDGVTKMICTCSIPLIVLNLDAKCFGTLRRLYSCTWSGGRYHNIAEFTKKPIILGGIVLIDEGFRLFDDKNGLAFFPTQKMGLDVMAFARGYFTKKFTAKDKSDTGYVKTQPQGEASNAIKDKDFDMKDYTKLCELVDAAAKKERSEEEKMRGKRVAGTGIHSAVYDIIYSPQNLKKTINEVRRSFLPSDLLMLEMVGSPGPVPTSQHGVTIVYALLALVENKSLSESIPDLSPIPPASKHGSYLLYQALEKKRSVLFEEARQMMDKYKEECDIPECREPQRSTQRQFLSNAFGKNCPFQNKNADVHSASYRLKQYCELFKTLNIGLDCTDTKMSSVIRDTCPFLYDIILNNGGTLPDRWKKFCYVYAVKILNIYTEDLVFRHTPMNWDVPHGATNTKCTMTLHAKRLDAISDKHPTYESDARNNTECPLILLARQLLERHLRLDITFHDDRDMGFTSSKLFMQTPYRNYLHLQDVIGDTNAFYAALGISRQEALVYDLLELGRGDNMKHHRPTEDVACRKFANENDTFGPGLMSACCSKCHNIVCSGFLDAHESPRGPTDMVLRLGWKGIETLKWLIYDNACHFRLYAMLRHPHFFFKIRFLIDKFHGSNHRTCSPLYQMRHWLWDEFFKTVASSINEVKHAHMDRVIPNIRFMTPKNAVNLLRLYIEITNSSPAPRKPTQLQHVIQDKIKRKGVEGQTKPNKKRGVSPKKS